ncbi:hypothetical protein LO772_15540 [Yinghuangia sp. ASG 101]|uniref:hypothetical protein n=1 Tax=Yinghuangia sp. ASG 101 TaxID=2896848 RepID=UPI001E5A078E|nr:hypothetical protein [Yinghuangia sp. ASG 101]UGQ14856.1 hypothetical protein LO772_15540 [Yinghuangia sp. ASG 101]
MPDTPASALLTEHPEPLITTDGFALACPNCRAVQDWLLIHYRGDTWIRCRCAHERPAPDNLDTTGDSDQPPPDRHWPTLDQAITALGFDGLLARTRWNA